MKKVSKWQIFLWNIRDKWRFSFIRKFVRIFWAYAKLYWALCYSKNKFSKLLKMDAEALIGMSPYGQRKYDGIITYVRSKIGDHGFQWYTRKQFFRDVFKKQPSIE